MEDEATATIGVKDFISTLQQLSDSAALWEGTPEVQNGARLESTINNMSQQVDLLRGQTAEVMATMKTIEKKLSELKEPEPQTGVAEAFTARPDDARPEQFVTAVKDRLLSGSWCLTFDKVEHMSDIILGILGSRLAGSVSKKRHRLRRELGIPNVVENWTCVGAEETATEAVGA